MTSALGLTSSPGKKAAQRLSREDAAHRAKKALADLELPLELDCKVKVERWALAADASAPLLARRTASCRVAPAYVLPRLEQRRRTRLSARLSTRPEATL